MVGTHLVASKLPLAISYEDATNRRTSGGISLLMCGWSVLSTYAPLSSPAHSATWSDVVLAVYRGLVVPSSREDQE
jgi:hypothetical protein